MMKNISLHMMSKFFSKFLSITAYLIIPLLMFSPIQYRHSIERNPIVYVIILLALTVLVINYKHFFRSQILNLESAFFIFFLAVILSKFFYQDTSPERLIVVVLYASYLVFFLGVGIYFKTLRSRWSYILYFIIMLCVLSVISNYNTLVNKYVDVSSEGVTYLWMYFGHNHSAFLYLFALPMVVVSYLDGNKLFKSNLPHVLIFLFLLMSFILTFSRSLLLSLGLSVIICGAWLGGPKLKKKYTVALIVSVLISMLLISGNFIGMKTFYKDNNGFAVRMAYWSQAVSKIYENPFLGTEVISREQHLFSYGNKRTTSVFAHNFYIQMLLDFGVIGALPFAVVILLSFKRIILSIKNSHERSAASLRAGVIIGAFAVLISGFLTFDLQIPLSMLIFWIFLSMAYHNVSYD
jgi:O-antigen ligase